MASMHYRIVIHLAAAGVLVAWGEVGGCFLAVPTSQRSPHRHAWTRPLPLSRTSGAASLAVAQPGGTVHGCCWTPDHLLISWQSARLSRVHSRGDLRPGRLPALGCPVFLLKALPWGQRGPHTTAPHPLKRIVQQGTLAERQGRPRLWAASGGGGQRAPSRRCRCCLLRRASPACAPAHPARWWCGRSLSLLELVLPVAAAASGEAAAQRAPPTTEAQLGKQTGWLHPPGSPLPLPTRPCTACLPLLLPRPISRGSSHAPPPSLPHPAS